MKKTIRYAQFKNSLISVCYHPANGEIYWYMNEEGDLVTTIWQGTKADNVRLYFGNVYYSRKLGKANIPNYADPDRAIQNPDNIAHRSITEVSVEVA